MNVNHRKRVEFSKQTRYLIAQRAGYRCSFPGCGRLTIGPSTYIDKASCIGIAAHIYSAAPSGPRGSGGLSPEELKSPENAIWLCGNHASLIDKHRGEEYPPDKLHSYKALHEAHIAYELSGIPTPFGWIDSIKIKSSPLFFGSVKIGLAKMTLIIGKSGSGKTALCEWLAGSINAQYMERWATIPSGRSRVHVDVDYHYPEPHSTSVSFRSVDHPEYKLDDKLTVVPIAPLRVVFPQKLKFRYNKKPNDLKLFSEALNLHPYEILALCEDMATNGSDYVSEASFEDSDDGCVMHATIKRDGPSFSLPFYMLSDSERVRVLIELGILAAHRYSVMNPTLLILDSKFWRLDTNWLRDYAALLGSPKWNFQTIATLGPRAVNFNDVKWNGWKIIQLNGIPPNVDINTMMSVTE